ncbi:hypothetical protein A3860_14705 [Niastella vici]|uniref:Uncharacterized protein n=1 Tax=Niastella vici TaxID=1703345 RepID=A0A1V9G5C1_9BACT|nr:hypothetical protein [Niastella vici]OQP65841.1 hypothetical protein A3860_14705 [Niastella vici]
MSKTKNKHSIDKEEWRKAKNELVQLIDEFLSASREIGGEPDVDYWVYYFFEPYYLNAGLSVYSNAAATALCMFATHEKIRHHFEQISEDNFEFLCLFLKKLVEFCDYIRSNECNVALLDKCKWEAGHNSHHSLKDIEKEKTRYLYKIKHLKEHTQISKSTM